MTYIYSTLGTLILKSGVESFSVLDWAHGRKSFQDIGFTVV